MTGLTSVPVDDRPTATQATIAHWAFDTMVVIGSLLILLALWYGWCRVRQHRLPASPWFFRGAACAGVASVVAVECGWITAEVGRQPWIVYRHMRIAEAVTATRSTSLWIMLGTVVVVYVFIFGSLLAVLLKMRTNWRLDDARGPAGERTGEPEADTPYGPRARVPAGDPPPDGGTAPGPAEDGRP